MLEVLEKYYNDGLVYKQVHPTLPLTIWNYAEKVQYEGLWDEVTLQTRGLVTDDKGNVVARPFKKFFNQEEGKHTPTVEFDVYAKMDGSLGILFNYDGEWVLATRGSFTSDQAVKEVMSSPSICALVVTAEAKSSVCHSKKVLETFSRPTLDMNGVSSGEI